MALKKNIQFDNGIVISNAYIKIKSVSGDKNWMTAYVGFYVDSTQIIPVKEQAYVFPADVGDTAKNMYKQAYEYLKTHADFAGAVDVLEDGQQA